MLRREQCAGKFRELNSGGLWHRLVRSGRVPAESNDPGRLTARVGVLRWFGGSLIDPHRED